MGELNSGQGAQKEETQNLDNSKEYTYQLRDSLISQTEKNFLSAIKSVLPQNYFIQPQVNLSSIIDKTDNTRFRNELFRNIDGCIFDQNYKPIVLVEINDSTHNEKKRIERDKKVKDICEEAGIPLVRFWTCYGINTDYMQNIITKAIQQAKNPVRIAHSQCKSNKDVQTNIPVDNVNKTKKQKKGCYVATCVYGSYDCPEVWVLRRYRDYTLSETWCGRAFIHLYYAISPTIVRLLGNKKWFKDIWKCKLDKKVKKLRYKGYSSTAYTDECCE